MIADLKQYLRELEMSHSKLTYPREREKLVRFGLWMKENKREFNRASVVEFMRHLKEDKKHSDSYCHVHEMLIKAFCSWMVKEGKIDKHFLTGLIIPFRAGQRGAEYAMTEEEYEKLKWAASTTDKEWYGAIILAWNTGLRLGDCCMFAWDSVNMEEKKVKLIPHKTKRTKKAVEIPILPELETYFASRWGPVLGNRFLFPRLSQRYLAAPSKPQQEFKELCRALEIKKTFHSFRHAMASRMINKGVPVSVVSSVTGHTLDVLQRYMHVSFEDKTKLMLEKMTV